MKIICIGRNYVDHAKELGNKVPEEPMFFLKPDSAVLPARNPFYVPEWTNDVHYEVELIIKISRLGKYIQKKHAHTYFEKVGLGIDFTARDVQKALKDKGHPWEKAKGFDGSAVVSRKFVSKDELDLENLNFSLEKNGEEVQKGSPNQMMFGFDDIISHLSQFMTLKIGDLIFTGTPAGVGPVKDGDQLVGYLNGQRMLKVDIK